MYEQSHIADDSHSFMAIQVGDTIQVYPFLTHSLFEAIGIIRLHGYDRGDLKKRINKNKRLQIFSHGFKESRLEMKTLEDLHRQFHIIKDYPLYCYVYLNFEKNQFLSYGIDRIRTTEDGYHLANMDQTPLPSDERSIENLYARVSGLSSKFTSKHIISHVIEHNGIVIEPVQNVFVDGKFVQYYALVQIEGKQFIMKSCMECQQLNCSCTVENLKYHNDFNALRIGQKT